MDDPLFTAALAAVEQAMRNAAIPGSMQQFSSQYTLPVENKSSITVEGSSLVDHSQNHIIQHQIPKLHMLPQSSINDMQKNKQQNVYQTTITPFLIANESISNLSQTSNNNNNNNSRTSSTFPSDSAAVAAAAAASVQFSLPSINLNKNDRSQLTSKNLKESGTRIPSSQRRVTKVDLKSWLTKGPCGLSSLEILREWALKDNNASLLQRNTPHDIISIIRRQLDEKLTPRSENSVRNKICSLYAAHDAWISREPKAVPSRETAEILTSRFIFLEILERARFLARENNSSQFNDNSNQIKMYSQDNSNNSSANSSSVRMSSSNLNTKNWFECVINENELDCSNVLQITLPPSAEVLNSTNDEELEEEKKTIKTIDKRVSTSSTSNSRCNSATPSDYDNSSPSRVQDSPEISMVESKLKEALSTREGLSAAINFLGKKIAHASAEHLSLNRNLQKNREKLETATDNHEVIELTNCIKRNEEETATAHKKWMAFKDDLESALEQRKTAVQDCSALRREVEIVRNRLEGKRQAEAAVARRLTISKANGTNSSTSLSVPSLAFESSNPNEGRSKRQLRRSSSNKQRSRKRSRTNDIESNLILGNNREQSSISSNSGLSVIRQSKSDNSINHIETIDTLNRNYQHEKEEADFDFHSDDMESKSCSISSSNSSLNNNSQKSQYITTEKLLSMTAEDRKSRLDVWMVQAEIIERIGNGVNHDLTLMRRILRSMGIQI